MLSNSKKLHYVGIVTGTAGINVYNANKELITGFSARDYGESEVLRDGEFDLPSGAAYVRATCSLAVLSDFCLDVAYLSQHIYCNK